MAGWGFNQVAAATSGTRAAILSAVVGQLAAGVMLIGLWVLNDRWQLGVAGGIEVVLGVWALSGVAPKPLRTA